MRNTPTRSTIGCCRVFGEPPPKTRNEQIVWVATFIRFEGIPHTGDCAIGIAFLNMDCGSTSSIERGLNHDCRHGQSEPSP
jgi:hypothetical protein